MTIKNSIVYEVRYGQTTYLTREGKTTDTSGWSTEQAFAQKFTVAQAHKIARRFNKGLDVGTPKRYGWTQI